MAITWNNNTKSGLMSDTAAESRPLNHHRHHINTDTTLSWHLIHLESGLKLGWIHGFNLLYTVWFEYCGRHFLSFSSLLVFMCGSETAPPVCVSSQRTYTTDSAQFVHYSLEKIKVQLSISSPSLYFTPAVIMVNFLFSL